MSNLSTKLIFGGSFDPIHMGHIQHIQSLSNDLAPCETFILPNALSPLKSKQYCSASQRLTCLELAIANYDNMILDTRELERQGPSYTLLSLQEYATEAPEHSIIFVLGMDSLQFLNRWYKWQELFEYANLLVINRPGFSDELNLELQQFLSTRFVECASQLKHFRHGKIAFSQQADIAISSTLIRKFLAHNASHPKLKQWLPKNVYDYIQSEGIYKP